ncbi:hypothetical protein Salat_1854500 [Sesamum alatum]|uniref:Uncharacterized protein n=1 Tax=Sesamum alatum TaxID=300844 RepID=A0AAE2CHW4_9LAMI|nr:hypothetical protein Salat_1854500 [Sesamum alatum]
MAIGCLARIHVKLPVNYVEFNHIPQHLKDMAWEEVEHNTTLPPEAKSVVLADLKDIWRRWKHEIKMKYFLPHIDDPEYLSQSPTECVEQDQWKELVIYWTDEDVQKIARKNSVNVSKKQCLHRLGELHLQLWNKRHISLRSCLRSLSQKENKEFNDEIFKNTMGEEKYRKLTGRAEKPKIENVIASMSFVHENEELKMLKDGLLEEREKIKQIQDEFRKEKEQLKLEKEKIASLSQKLEELISQLPTLSSMLPTTTQVRN